jgi:uncharacterized protein (DUF488 family)
VLPAQWRNANQAILVGNPVSIATAGTVAQLRSHPECPLTGSKAVEEHTCVVQLFTIGVTRKSAKDFFLILRRAGVRRIVDVRSDYRSRLAGYSKRDDLQFFLETICNIEYVYSCELAPTRQLVGEFRKHRRDWPTYERRFLSLMAQRRIEQQVPRYWLDLACLLGSESEPGYCHRRLVAEYLCGQWGGLNITHL